MENIKENAGLVFGAVILGIVIGVTLWTYGFGYMSSSDAQTQADDAVLDTLASLCVTNAQSDPNQIAEIKAMSSSTARRTAVTEAGWVAYPEGTNSRLSRNIAQECANRL